MCAPLAFKKQIGIQGVFPFEATKCLTYIYKIYMLCLVDSVVCMKHVF